MCVGIPMRIVVREAYSGIGSYRGRDERIDLCLTPDAQVGDHVLVFLGAARVVIDETYARQVADALCALDAVAEGRSVDFAFTDLATREPQLPPHLESADRLSRASEKPGDHIDG